MRIIAGEAKGIKLKMVPGNHVRPTSDRVKESLFHMLGPYFDGGRVLDLFAGTGALGLEALSRGMAEAVFVDQSGKSLQTIRQNIAQVKMKPRTCVLQKEAKLACRVLAKQAQPFDLIFLDPPYRLPLLLPMLQEIDKGALLAEHGQIVVESPPDACLLEEIGKLKKADERRYGSTMITIYRFQQGEME
jgi:16S rRNA (guanine966-N2)-methyltransferase